MIWLFLSSVILAFSIPLNKKILTGLDPFIVSAGFCIVSAIFFLPFLNCRGVKRTDFFKLCLIGFVQFGLMYSLFQASFSFLQGHEVAILLISTPMYVVIIDNILNKKWNKKNISIALFVILLAALLVDFSQKFYFQWQGILLIQGCNFAFALGQVLLKRFCSARSISNILPFNSILYFGAALACIPFAIFSFNSSQHLPLTIESFVVVLLFGVVCCGICHWLWNLGVVNTNIRTLAVMNNLQIPLAVAVSCVIFNEKIDWSHFTLSVVIMLAMIFPLIFFRKNREVE